MALVVAACGTNTGIVSDDVGSGGTASGARGGTTAAGGSSGSGVGGSSGKGGQSGSGGSSTGGSSTGGTGGMIGTGGSSGSGSMPCTNVRPTGTDWDEATCAQWANESEECSASWMIDNNYCNESCGRCSGGSAGAGGTGGSSGGSGGSGPAVVIPPSGCNEPERTVCNNQTQMHCGYTSEYWKDAGTGCMINTADGFSIDWTDVSNLLARKGIRPGSADLVVTYDAEYEPVGTSYLNVYGWMQGPLVEYYIVDSWGEWRPPGDFPVLATIESDGGTYEIYRTERTNAPSIEGNKDFSQYWSIRTTKRNSGVITVGNHFSAWQRNGMPTGRLYEVSLNVEGYMSSGLAHVRMMID